MNIKNYLMVLNFKKFTSGFLPIFFIAFVIHVLLLRAVPQFLGISYKMLFETYGFLLVLTLSHFLVLRWLFKKWPKFAGLLFTALSLLKMAFCILFLFPYIMPSSDASIPIALNFMTVYFTLLMFEVVFLVKNMNLVSELNRTNKNH